jgi:hypothetical protein
MMKRTVHALVLMLLATPLALVGCGDSGEKNGTGGSGGRGGAGGAVIPDGGGGAGGAKLDVGGVPDVTPPPVDTAPGTPDVALPIDTTLIVDATIPDVPIVPDVPITIDTVKIDVSAPVDIAAPIDIASAIDTTPAVCTIVPAFTGGALTANLTLTKACSPYDITDSISVDGNATLTIEAGVTLKFENGVGLGVGYSTNGKLVAVGTAQDPITFTSAAPTPAAGDWAKVSLWSNTMGGTQIAYARLDYCGSDADGCIVTANNVKPGRVTLDHLTIAHVGAGSDGILENDAASNIPITNSSFSNIPTAPTQQYAISVQAPSFVGIGSTNTFNGGARIELAGGTITATTAWVNPGAPIAVTSGVSIEGAGSPILTIGSGMTFMFDVGTSVSVGYSTGGQLVVAGTAAQHVVFTSLAATPAPGDWEGVMIWASGKAQISYADVSYGGNAGSTPGNLILEQGNSTSTLAVDHSSFTYSLGYGIYVDCGNITSTPLATVTLTSNTYAHNAIDTGNANTEATNVGPGLNCP